MAAEKIYENKIKKWLDERGAYWFKYWAGGGFTKAGIPDLIICYRGKFVGAEVKAANGKPTLIQLVNLEKIRQAGGIGVLLYPKDFSGFTDLLLSKSDTSEWYENNIKLQQELKEELLKNGNEV